MIEVMLTDTEKLQQLNSELSILNAIADALSREVDLSQALYTVLGQVSDLLGLETSWIFLLPEGSEKEEDFYTAAARNLPSGLIEDPARMEGSCYCQDTYIRGDLDGVANVNVVRCSRLRGMVEEGLDEGTEGLRYHSSIPLYAYSKKLGVLNVASTDWRKLSADDKRLLYIIGDMLSIAIQRARLFERSSQMGAIEERNRLARELHDTLAQGLTAITLQLESADALLESNVSLQDIQRVIRRTLELTRFNLDEVRRSVMDLRAAPLEGHSLADALLTLVQNYRRTCALNFEVNIMGASQPLPVRVEVGLYRILQESINNILKHAQAKQVTLTLVASSEVVRLEIEDDGCGFDPQQIPDHHFGIIGMNERARLLGGKLLLESCPGQGTRIDIMVPLV
jgi:two-component system, NarL family, sensor kinase